MVPLHLEATKPFGDTVVWVKVILQISGTMHHD